MDLFSLYRYKLFSKSKFCRLEKNQNAPIDYDTHWKSIITNLFEDFVLFFLPNAHKLIDFQTPVVFLEQELHKIIAKEWSKNNFPI